MHYFDVGVINEQEALKLLKGMYPCNGVSKTNVSCAVTYLSFKAMGLMEKNL